MIVRIPIYGFTGAFPSTVPEALWCEQLDGMENCICFVMLKQRDYEKRKLTCGDLSELSH